MSWQPVPITTAIPKEPEFFREASRKFKVKMVDFSYHSCYYDCEGLFIGIRDVFTIEVL